VGITTLEEVFLKIGHGDQAEPEQEKFDKDNVSPRLTASQPHEKINLSNDI